MVAFDPVFAISALPPSAETRTLRVRLLPFAARAILAPCGFSIKSAVSFHRAIFTRLFQLKLLAEITASNIAVKARLLVRRTRRGIGPAVGRESMSHFCVRETNCPTRPPILSLPFSRSNFLPVRVNCFRSLGKTLILISDTLSRNVFRSIYIRSSSAFQLSRYSSSPLGELRPFYEFPPLYVFQVRCFRWTIAKYHGDIANVENLAKR